jgi:hypothetical protein
MTNVCLPPWSPLLCTLKPRFRFASRSGQDQQVSFEAKFLHQFGPFDIGIRMRDDAARERVSGHQTLSEIDGMIESIKPQQN